MFRAVHTVKGMSATMGYGGVAALAHELESVLDRVRQRARKVAPDLMDVLFKSADALERAIAVRVAGTSDDAGGARDGEDAARTTREGRRPLGGRPSASAGEGARSTRASAASRSACVLNDGIALKGARAFLVVKRAARFGRVLAVEPPSTCCSARSSSREFTIRLAPSVEPSIAAEALRDWRAMSRRCRSTARR